MFWDTVLFILTNLMLSFSYVYSTSLSNTHEQKGMVNIYYFILTFTCWARQVCERIVREECCLIK
jgi:hypothetical protein